MIYLESPKTLTKAAERARAANLFVRPTPIFRQYRVTNRDTGAQHFVNFFVRNGKRFGHCTCAAGMNNIPCKHLAASAGLHVCLAAQKAAA